MSGWADSHVVVVVVADIVVIVSQVCKVLQEKLGVRRLVELTATLLLMLSLLLLILSLYLRFAKC